jgi:hypothetical protein
VKYRADSCLNRQKLLDTIQLVLASRCKLLEVIGWFGTEQMLDDGEDSE